MVVLGNTEFYKLKEKILSRYLASQKMLHITCIDMGEKPVPKMEYITLKQTFEFLMLILA